MPHTLPQCTHLCPREPPRLWTTRATRNGASTKTALSFSMGPTPFSVGYPPPNPSAELSPGASMGPPPFSVGYIKSTTNGGRHENASMGPTPFSVGYGRRLPIHGASCPRFNGANAFQRWIRHMLDDLRNAESMLQWGQRLSALDTNMPAPVNELTH